MTIQDTQPDLFFTTPGGKPLPAGARNPHQQVDVVHGGSSGGGDPTESVIVLNLVDVVAEHQEGGGDVVKTPAWADGNGWQFTSLSGTPVSNWDGGYWGYTNGTDGSTSFKVTTQINVNAGQTYRIENSINWPQQGFRYIVNGIEYPISGFLEGTDWVSSVTGSVELGIVVGTNATSGGWNNFYVHTIEGATTVPQECTPFVRVITDGVVEDFEADGVTPYTVVGAIENHCPGEGESGGEDQIIQLVDVYEVGGPVQESLPVPGDWQLIDTGGTVQFSGNSIEFNNQSPNPIYAGLVRTNLVVGRVYTIGASFSNGFAGMSWLLDGNPVEPFTNAQFTATSTVHQLYLQQDAMSGQTSVNNFVLYSTIPSGTECHTFLRKVSGSTVTDLELDGVTPYVVQGEVRANCPGSCGCTEELAGLQASLDSANVKLQALLDATTGGTPTELGQPILTLTEGTWTKTQIASNALGMSMIQASNYIGLGDFTGGCHGKFGVQSISFVPSSDFTLSVAGSTPTFHDYLFEMSEPKVPNEVDDFTVTVPAGQTLNLHMVVWVKGVAS